jgi:glycine cleavage system regulatory protein
MAVQSPQNLVMSVLCADRPGLVSLVAEIVAAHHGNWLESRMARLGGQFAGILRVQVPESQIMPLREALQKMTAQGISVSIAPDASPDAAAAAPENLASLEVVGQDRPGIVREISQALARAGVNVEELHTECSSAAMSGESLFQARARLYLPMNCDLDALRHSLEKIAADLIVEVNLEPLTSTAK